MADVCCGIIVYARVSSAFCIYIYIYILLCSIIVQSVALEIDCDSLGRVRLWRHLLLSGLQWGSITKAY